MAYFSRDTGRQSPQRRQGKHVGGPAPVPPTKVVASRDERLDHERDAMQRNADAQAGGVLRYVGDTEHRRVKTRNPNHKPDNNIFGPPVAVPSPRPRIRAGVSDEELQRIWAEDERKSEAAAKMTGAPTMIDRMAAEPVNPVTGSARPKDWVPPPKKQLNTLSDTTVERSRDAFEPAGFSGMGQRCKPGHREGRSCKPQEDFQAPELKLKERHQGRRTKFPPDTLSFQDDAQTA